MKKATKPPMLGAAEILTLKQLAQYLNCHTSTLYRLVKDNRVPYFRLGGSYRFQKSIIDKWITKESHVRS
jgi:excisionase family DNA binding protein